MNPMETSSIYWHFPMLIITVSMVYSATRFEKWNQIFWEAFHWGRRMTVFLLTIGVGLHVIPLLNGWGFLIAGIAGFIIVIIYFLMSKPRAEHG